MIFTIKPCNFGYTCITVNEGVSKLCGVELGETSEEALFNSLIRFGKGTGDKVLNNGKLVGHDNTIRWIEDKLSVDVLKVINGEKEGTELFNKNDLDYPYGTSTWFQRNVWNVIWSLNRGEVISYKELSIRAKMPGSLRAIATACGKNPFAVIVPCHRIIRSNNDSGKYRWGTEIKKELLRREGYLGI